MKPSQGLFCRVRDVQFSRGWGVTGSPCSFFPCSCCGSTSIQSIKIRDGSFQSFCKISTALGSVQMGDRGGFGDVRL